MLPTHPLLTNYLVLPVALVFGAAVGTAVGVAVGAAVGVAVGVALVLVSVFDVSIGAADPVSFLLVPFGQPEIGPKATTNAHVNTTITKIFFTVQPILSKMREQKKHCPPVPRLASH
jgi:hypothetical protein